VLTASRAVCYTVCTPMTAKKKQSQILHMRLTDDDRDLIERLQAKTRLTTVAEVVRQGLRALAEKEKMRA
jgi:hypothetical protein